MVNAGIIPITIVDSHLAEFWVSIFDDIKVHSNLTVRTGGKIAWAIRKNCPLLKKEINEFVKSAKKGTLLGNILFKRYLKTNKWVKNPLAAEERKRYEKTIELFEKYSGEYGFDWVMIAALAYQESGIDQSKRSPAGAVGVMQILPTTAAAPPVSIPEITIIDKNIHAGVKYLDYLHRTYFSDKSLDPLNQVLFTFAAYNAGPARVRQLRERTQKMGLDPNEWFQNVERAAAKVIGRETVQYVSNIYKYYLAYSRIQQKEQKKIQAKESIAPAGQKK
jgi:membrane-bound lytic murein transglycosylase MltF